MGTVLQQRVWHGACMIVEGLAMARLAKLTDSDRARLVDGVRTKAAAAKAADGDVLHFLSRTLQAHFLDAEPADMLEKLRNLKTALDQQEATLSRWADSPAKERICAALAKAKTLVTEIADEFAKTTDDEGLGR
jgi:hypothetical protein